MANFSDVLESSILRRYFKNDTSGFSAGATTLYVALSTAVYADSMTGAAMSEVTGTGYARQPITSATGWSTITDGVMSNVNEVKFTATAADWSVPIKSMVIVDSVSGAGNVLIGVNLSADVTVLGSGDSISFAPTTGIVITVQ